MFMHELICPNCGKPFRVDEADYASILNQVKGAEFDAEVARRISELHKQHEAEEKARVAAAETEYYTEHAKPFIEQVKNATTMAQLLKISKDMAKDGFKFPVSGMLDGTPWQEATLDNVRWMSYDREGEETAESLSDLEENNKAGSVVNEYMVYTYYYSWRWWIANIIRCLVFWKDPYGAEANEKVKEYIQKIAPHTPIIRKFPTYFKEGAK